MVTRRASVDMRRLLLAAGLALVTLAWSVGAAGLVAGAVADDGQIPTRFGVAAPRQGDHAVYTVSVVERDEDGTLRPLLTDAPFSEFAWRGPDVVRDDNGVEHRTQRLWHAKTLGGPEGVPAFLNSTFHFDMAQRQPVAWSFDSEFTNLMQGTSLLGQPASTLTEFDLRWRLFFDPQEPTISNLVLDCGIRNALQGRTMDLTQGIPLLPGCTLIALGTPVVVFPVLVEETDVFRAAGVDLVAGHETIVFEAATRFGQIWVWMSEDVPYPLQISVQRSPDQERFNVFRLASFARGGTMIMEAGSVAAEPAPDHVWAERHVYGPADNDTDHVFPLSAAFSYAVQDPDASQLRQFLDQNPEAYVAAASYAEAEQDEAVQRRWDFAVTDGERWLPVGLVRTDAPLGGIPFLPLPPGESQYAYDNASAARNLTLDEDGQPRPAVDPGRLPGDMPTVASQMARWQAYAQDALAAKQPNYWSFQIRCKDAGCAGSELVVAAGLQEVRIEAGLEGSITGDHNVHQNLSAMSVTYPIDGPSGALAQPDRVSYLLEMSAPEQNPGGAPAATVAMAPGGEVRAPQQQDASWVLPPASWLVVFAVMAMLAAAAVYAAPWIRSAWRRRVTNPAARHVLSALAETQALSVSELVAATRRPETEVLDALARLQKAGRVTASRAAGRRVFAVSS